MAGRSNRCGISEFRDCSATTPSVYENIALRIQIAHGVREEGPGTGVDVVPAMARKSKRPQAAVPESAGSSDAQAASSSEHISHYDRDRVAARAYEIYMQRGGAGGSEMDDWLAAEREFTNGPSEPHDE